MKEKVQKVIDKIRPSLQADGGDVELIDVVDGYCHGEAPGGLCRMSHVPDDPQERH